MKLNIKFYFKNVDEIDEIVKKVNEIEKKYNCYNLDLKIIHLKDEGNSYHALDAIFEEVSNKDMSNELREMKKLLHIIASNTEQKKSYLTKLNINSLEFIEDNDLKKLLNIYLSKSNTNNVI